MSRTPEEREAARLERERKRAAREGGPLPPVPAPAAAPPPPAEARRVSGLPDSENVEHLAEPAHDAQPTQMFDVTTQWTDERAAVPAEAEPESLDAPKPEPVAAAPTLTLEPDEVPLGTRRVARHERAAGEVPKRGRGGKPPAPP
ncbi:MAG: hypothetical protein ACJ76L_02735, partial [Conexibacter sp.]